MAGVPVRAGLHPVAPFTGAWIETGIALSDTALPIVAPFTGAWIETIRSIRLFRPIYSRSLHGSVD